MQIGLGLSLTLPRGNALTWVPSGATWGANFVINSYAVDDLYWVPDGTTWGANFVINSYAVDD